MSRPSLTFRIPAVWNAPMLKSWTDDTMPLLWIGQIAPWSKSFPAR